MKKELDCPFDFTSRCNMDRCDCKPKQETLEEVAKKYVNGRCTGGIMERALLSAIEFGAKWQQERSYSEEKVKPLLDAIKYFIDRVENGTIRSKATYNMYKEVLSQFKNK